MKKGKIAFLAGLLACSLAGVATASALIVTGAHAPQQEGTTDSVLYLEWGSQEDLSNISNLTPDAPQYRKVSVAAPQKSASAPNGKFTVSLGLNMSVDPDAGNERSADGLSIDIYDTAFNNDGSNTGTRVGSGALTTETSPISEVVTAAKVYYLKISIDATEYAKYLDAGTYKKELMAVISFSYGPNLA